jgi:hypothetical protein
MGLCTARIRQTSRANGQSGAITARLMANRRLFLRPRRDLCVAVSAAFGGKTVHAVGAGSRYLVTDCHFLSHLI